MIYTNDGFSPAVSPLMRGETFKAFTNVHYLHTDGMIFTIANGNNLLVIKCKKKEPIMFNDGKLYLCDTNEVFASSVTDIVEFSKIQDEKKLGYVCLFEVVGSYKLDTPYRKRTVEKTKTIDFE